MRITKANLSNAQYNQYCFIGGNYCEDYPTCKESILMDMEDDPDVEIGILIKPSLLDKALEFWTAYKLPKIKLVRENQGSFELIRIDYNSSLFKYYVFIDLFVMCIKAAQTGKENLITGIEYYSTAKNNEDGWGEAYEKYLSLSNLQLKRLISNEDVLRMPGLYDLYKDFCSDNKDVKGKRKL